MFVVRELRVSETCGGLDKKNGDSGFFVYKARGKREGGYPSVLMETIDRL